MSYSSYNKLVKDWSELATYTSELPMTLDNWTNPNLISLMNNIESNDLSLQYIPEPYWGNIGLSNDELHAVVINYNPIAGSEKQQYLQSQNLFGFKNYREFVQSEINRKTTHLSTTTMWHSSNRAMRVFNTLKEIKAIHSKTSLSILNHLSIQLIPWHTKDTHQIRTYICNNLSSVFNYSIKFASREAARIANSKLKNVVIMRMNNGTATWLLQQFQVNNICTYNIVSNQITPKGNAEYLEFKIDSISQTRFVCIWKTNGNLISRNDFPDKEDMEWIFKYVI